MQGILRSGLYFDSCFEINLSFLLVILNETDGLCLLDLIRSWNEYELVYEPFLNSIRKEALVIMFVGIYYSN